MHRPTLAISNLYEALVAPEAAVEALCATLHTSGRFPIAGGELSIAFLDDPAIARVHAEFMDDPSPTDVITFPAAPEMHSAGEILVSVDHARSRARELKLPFSRELSLYLIHGWLHLAGFDDRCEADQKAMRQAEAEALALLDARESFPQFKLR